MTPPLRLPCVGRTLLLCALLLPGLLWSRGDEWKDLDGNKFKGEPAGLLGPLALFRIHPNRGRLVLLTKLSPADCVRFAESLDEIPPRAAKWSDAEGIVTDDLLGHAQVLRDGKLVDTDLADRPEPKVLIVFFGSHSVGRSWGMMGDATDLYKELQEEFPGECEGLFVGLGNKGWEHEKMANDMTVPWIVAENDSIRKMDTIERFAPVRAPWIVALSRNGVPLVANDAGETEDVQKLMRQVQAFLRSDEPNNPQTWEPRKYFYRHVQVARHGGDRGDPMIVGSPLKASALEKYGVTGFTAQLSVNAEGKVTNVVIEPGPGIPDDLIPAVANALRSTPVVPAVYYGQFVAGEVTFVFPGS